MIILNPTLFGASDDDPLSGLHNYASIGSGPYSGGGIGGGINYSSQYTLDADFSVSGAFRGYRHTRSNWGGVGPGDAFSNGWNSSGLLTGGNEWIYRYWNIGVEIHVVVLVTLANAVNYSTDPELEVDTFTNYGLTEYIIQSNNPSNWTDVPTVGHVGPGNNKVGKIIDFRSAPITASAFRCLCITGGMSDAYARIVAFECWGPPGQHE